MLVSIIIPTYKDWPGLAECLSALESQSIAKDAFEVIVVNNDMESNFPDSITGYSFVLKKLTEEKPGSYAARNLALNEVEGQLIAFTDSDCKPHPDWLKNGLRYFDENSETNRVGGNVVIDPVDPGDISSIYDRFFAFRQKRFVELRGFSVTANLWVRRKFFAEVGNFNATLMSGGDYEWNIRANQHENKLIYAEDVVVYHPPRSKRESLSKVRRVYAKDIQLVKRSKIRLFLKGVILLKPKTEDLQIAMRQQEFPGWWVKFKLIMFIILRRLITFTEHYRLLFGGNPIRT